SRARSQLAQRASRARSRVRSQARARSGLLITRSPLQPSARRARVVEPPLATCPAQAAPVAVPVVARRHARELARAVARAPRSRGQHARAVAVVHPRR